MRNCDGTLPVKSVCRFVLWFLLVLQSVPLAANAQSQVGWTDAITGQLTRTANSSRVLVSSNLHYISDLKSVDGCQAYFTEPSSQAIFRLDISQAAVPAWLRSTSLVPSSIAIDDYMYWSDEFRIRKGTANSDSGADATLINYGQLQAVRGLVLDPPHGKVYWLDSGRHPASPIAVNKIRRANLDGTLIEDIANTSGASHLAIDVANQKLYWSENSGVAKLKRSNLDGTSAVTLTNSGFRYIKKIAVGTDGIYALDLDGTIRRVSFDGITITDIVSDISLGTGLMVIPDADHDGNPDCTDRCPLDATKTSPGVCGCGVEDKDTDGDGTLDCIESCPNDPAKVAPGLCGCGVADIDSDHDGIPDCRDSCPRDPTKTAPGLCGCGVADIDTDRDGIPDCKESCPLDGNKILPGRCGCGVSDNDSDGDGVPDCLDLCPADSNKILPLICGCGKADIDTDQDGVLDCNDLCPEDKNKIIPGTCGCGKFEIPGSTSCSVFRPLAEIVTPETATVTAVKKCVSQITMEQFSLKKGAVQYRIILRKTGSKKPTVIISKRYKTNLPLPKAGTYTLEYQAFFKTSGSNKVTSSKVSKKVSLTAKSQQCSEKK